MQTGISCATVGAPLSLTVSATFLGYDFFGSVVQTAKILAHLRKVEHTKKALYLTYAPTTAQHPERKPRIFAMPDIHSHHYRRETPAAPTLSRTSIDDIRRDVADERKHRASSTIVSPPAVSGIIVAGGELSKDTREAVNTALAKTPAQWHRFVAYEDVVKVGGSLAWRANNPGNLRDATTKIGTVPGAVGTFAVFATLDQGRAAQRDLYLSKYGDRKVRDAIVKLTPPSENDTEAYLANLQKEGVDLNRDVTSQIEVLMRAIEKNEGFLSGTEVKRLP